MILKKARHQAGFFVYLWRAFSEIDENTLFLFFNMF